MYTMNDSDHRIPQFSYDAGDISWPGSWTGKHDCLMSDSELSSYCTCESCMDEGCIWCCRQLGKCCICYHCTECWARDWSLVTATQISIFVLFVLGIVSVIIMYFRICRRPAPTEYSCPVLQNERNEDCTSGPPYASAPSELPRDMPPSYNEACSAPPLYTAPYNRVSMLDAPPVYPDSPKTQERVPHSDDPTITNHI